MKKVLFLCVGNSCRSQMAEGLLNRYGADEYRAYSAGSKPEKEINPFAIKVMAEIGIDISQAIPKHVSVFNNDY
ncbi:MAG: arsenate reductase ArsC, partial [Proteobacteria bacterium]|nr:arsenate reductase ArsC [Pseudomonadota bacterium]